MGSTTLGRGTLLAAGDVYHNDGPFDNADDYNRINTVLRYHRGDTNDFLTLTAMGYYGKWNATDQVPAHAIDAGINSVAAHSAHNARFTRGRVQL